MYSFFSQKETQANPEATENHNIGSNSQTVLDIG